MIRYIIVIALMAAWAKFPSIKVKPKQTWEQKQKFAKDFQVPNTELDYSMYE